LILIIAYGAYKRKNKIKQIKKGSSFTESVAEDDFLENRVRNLATE
jgi:hypothetical protein